MTDTQRHLRRVGNALATARSRADQTPIARCNELEAAGNELVESLRGAISDSTPRWIENYLNAAIERYQSRTKPDEEMRGFLNVRP